MRTRPGAVRAPFLFAPLAAAALGLGLPPARAATDPVAINRAYFPDRTWAPQTAVDAALVGAGRASDSLSSWVVNPALVARYAASGRAQARVTGLFLDPHRNDIAGNSVDFSDTSPFLSFGESGVAAPVAGGVLLLALDQPSYHQEETAFIDTTAGSPATFRTNTARSSWQRASLGYARSFGDYSVGLALQGIRGSEAYETVPSDVAIGFGVVPGSVDLRGTGLTGTAGVAGRPAPWLSVGGAWHLACDLDWQDENGNAGGQDHVPEGFDLGGTLGRGLGGNLAVGAAWSGERRATLPDSLGRGEEISPARWNLAAGYTYRSRGAPWEFRAGFGWSPRPSGGGARASRFGVGLGYDLGGLRLRGSFSGESLESASAEKSSRRFFTLGADFDL